MKDHSDVYQHKPTGFFSSVADRTPFFRKLAKLGLNLPQTAKETGHLWPYYIYMTVFIRNAANLAPKTSRTTFTSEVFL
jgi:hypothetical protein